MTEKLYDIDSHLKEFTATVIDSYEKADGYFTILDRTAFFPEGGGQPSDTGYINDIRVYDVRINDGVIYHYTAKQLQKGEKIVARLDFDRRFDFMQQHSAEHIVSGVAHKLYGCENVGFHLSDEIVTLDFDKPLTKAEILEIEKLSNEAVFSNSKINAYYPDTTELASISYRSKKEIKEAVRIVEIEGVDACACCAPHVSYTGEIGLIKLLGTEKLRGGVRIELKAGKRAFLDYSEKYKGVLKISNALCVKQNEVYDAVEKLLGQISEMKYELTGLKNKMLEHTLENFNSDTECSALFLDGLGIKELQTAADTLYKKLGGIRAVLSENESGFMFAVCGDEDALNKYFGEFRQSFSVKGGGRNGMIQGTVIASREELEKFWAKNN